jgi:hypothetical protein
MYRDVIDQFTQNPDSGLPADQVKELLAEANENYTKVYNAYEHGDSLSEPIAMYPISQLFELSMDAMANGLPLVALLKKAMGPEIFTPQVYTKPVFFVTNELDFSGGDATPATLQDYGRVNIVGVRTAGAGGTVEEFSSLATSDIKFRLTTSLMYRKGGKYVENYGVQPDIAFGVTRADYRDGFKDTFERLLKTLGL